LNLPIVPITDLAIKNNDLVVATQGRSFWVLDDLTPLHQLTPDLDKKSGVLFRPRPTYRLPGGSGEKATLTEGQNPPNGAVIHYYLKEDPGKNVEIALEIATDKGQVIRRYSTLGKSPEDKLTAKKGMNRLVWDLRYPKAEDFPGLVLWGTLPAPRAVPGTYIAKLWLEKQAEQFPFVVLPDPRSSATQEDLISQLVFLLSVRDKLTEIHRTIKQIRDMRDQLNAMQKRLTNHNGAAKALAQAKEIDKTMTVIEETLYQTKLQSSQDILNYPMRLNNKLVSLASLVGMGDARPTDQAHQVRAELSAQIDPELFKWQQLLREDLPRFNDLLESLRVPAIFLPKDKGTSNSK
jgi:hypothetical protein